MIDGLNTPIKENIMQWQSFTQFRN